jgi:hypothetical protein
VADRLYCRKGHKWTPAFNPAGLLSDLRSDCPVCGGPPIGPFDVTETTGRVMIVLTAVFPLLGLLLLAFPKVWPAGIVLLIIGFVIPLVGLGIRYSRQRTKAMAELARAMGLDFTANVTLARLRAIAPFRLYARGHSQKAYNALFGLVGDAEVVLAQYQYTTGSGKSQQTWNQTVVILPDAAVDLPDFEIAPRTFLDKLFSFFTQRGVELPDAAEFNGRCLLTGRDEDALRRLFRPELADYFARHGDWFVEATAGQLLVYRKRSLSPDACPGLVTEALELRDVLQAAAREEGLGPRYAESPPLPPPAAGGDAEGITR